MFGGYYHWGWLGVGLPLFFDAALVALVVLQVPARVSNELKAIGIKGSLFSPDMPTIAQDIEQEMNIRSL